STMRSIWTGPAPANMAWDWANWAICARSMATPSTSCGASSTHSIRPEYSTPARPCRRFNNHGIKELPMTTDTAWRDPVVTVEWLADNLSRVRLLDATYLMPADPEAAHAMYLQAHIAGAGFFEIDRVADHSQPLPHMMPDAELLALELGRL